MDLAHELAAALRNNMAVIDVAGSLRAAEEAVLATSHDVIVLDRGLPDGDGISLIAFMRRVGATAAVLVLTARSEVVERVRSLDEGADDYLAKPFSIDELLARVRALARRPASRADMVTTVGRLRFEHHERHALVDGHALNLPRRELLLLEALVESKGRTVRRELLLERVYGEQEDMLPNALDPHVSRLRTKLSNARARVEIHAIRGVGYLINETVGS